MKTALASAAVALIAALPPARAEDTRLPPQLITHESYVEEIIRDTKLAIDDPQAVFAFVLANVPPRAKIYPTENYYYFSFIHAGKRYAGNIRLDAMDRDQGKLHFAYYEDLTEWKDEPEVKHVVLDLAAGVAVERVEKLTYRVSYRDRTVVFELNDLSKVVPPSGAIAPEEKYLGPIFDDSAIRFFLVYNPRLKIFHYILDETEKVVEDFFAARGSDRILIGRRTGFAFYRDQKLERKILIGVFEGNARVNNYFDGPFDQLPDNFIEGEALREIILQVEPGLAGRIDRLGGSFDGSDRFLISPYLHYRSEDDLLVFHQCATDKSIAGDQYYACFVVDPKTEEGNVPRAEQAKRKMVKRPIRKQRNAARR
jgi:hypothetical protein